MKRAVVLALCLFVAGVVLPAGGSHSAQSNDNFRSFWTSFKTAVIDGRSETVANLSKFPIGVSQPVPEIRDRSALRKRFRELFSEPINAAECFARTEPTQDTERPEVFTVACRFDRGSDAAAYQFEHTKLGWRFTHFQLTTTCRCR
jgi:hypothetical protein